MMSKEKRRVPKLRFPGFTEDWERRKLTSFTQRVKGNDGRMDLPTLTISASEGWLNQKDRFSANIAGSEQKNYTLLRQGELSYNHGNSKLAKYGVVYALQEYKEALVPRVYHSFKVDESHDALFVEYYFSTKRPDRELRKLISSGARMDGLLNIGYDEFTNISISLPTFSEQKQIVALLKVCNKNITVHQRKIEHLNLKKKALLQKLFPQNGECYPEHRFPGFTDAWEQRKLGDIVDFLDGQRKPLKESERIKGKYPYYGASGIIDYINAYLFDENLVLLSEDGANIIDRNYPICFIATGKYWVNNHAHVLKVKTGVIDKFICESLERLDYTKFNTGTAQPKLNQDICQKIVITIPNEDEQKCISEFLDRINNIITLHQQEPFLCGNSVNGGVKLC